MSKEQKALIPNDDGQSSTGASVGKKVAQLLGALDALDHHVAHGSLIEKCQKFRAEVLENLLWEEWRIKVTAADKWQVLPPK